MREEEVERGREREGGRRGRRMKIQGGKEEKRVGGRGS